jgi:acetyl-CoA decarbonylase/synthase complex subunit gamma
MSYRVEPRLYAVGSPTDTSPVFVTANYKMSFDRLRSALCGRDGWILVLDTHGINVWCAAGKGTFGTDEIVRRIEVVRLDRVVSHRTLVVPQLGAVGVAAHEVRARSGFAVTYGPVRAEDLPAFLDAEMTATPEMRRVKFTFRDRVALIPVELVASGRYVLLAAVCFALLSGLNGSGYSFALVGSSGAMNAMLLAIAALGGAAIAPALLPWLPGRALATKGACLGMLLNLGIVAIAGTAGGWFESLWSLNGWLLMVPAVVSFMTMNFTGSTPYTSLSGVRREMRFAIPGQMFLGLAGLVLWVVGRFV